MAKPPSVSSASPALTPSSIVPPLPARQLHQGRAEQLFFGWPERRPLPPPNCFGRQGASRRRSRALPELRRRAQTRPRLLARRSGRELRLPVRRGSCRLRTLLRRRRHGRNTSWLWKDKNAATTTTREETNTDEDAHQETTRQAQGRQQAPFAALTGHISNAAPEAACASRTLHGALSDALAILAPVHGQDLAQTLVGEIISGSPPIATQPPARPPVSATLSPQASELVRWYCGITHHHETDAVEGEVFGVLERARDAHEGPAGGDEGFNFILEDVLRAMNDDSRQSLHRRYGGGYTAQMDIEASALVSRFQEATGCDLRDIVSACVGYTLDETHLFEPPGELVRGVVGM